jgi:uncharacterized protein YlxP (DUF503 family)
MSGTVYVGVAHLELHLPEARSLKDKRGAVRPLAERMRNRHQVLVTEIDHQDLHQRATFAIAALSTDAVDLESRLQRVRRTVDDSWSGFVLAWEVEILQLEAGAEAEDPRRDWEASQER